MKRTMHAAADFSQEKPGRPGMRRLAALLAIFFARG
jgi:hypothetical protein